MKKLCLLPSAAALIGIAGCGPASQQKETPVLPNIVIILADDMGFGDVRALNPASRIATPAIDAMVTEGISFTNAHAGASVCTPSRYGLLTGRLAFRTPAAASGISGFNRPVIEPGRETMASLLKKAGYNTACVGKWHLGFDWALKDGAEEVIYDAESGYSNVDYGKPIQNGPNDYGFDYSFIHPASLDIAPYVYIRDHQVVDPEVILTTDFYPRRKENTVYAWDKKHSNEQAVYWEKGVWWRQGEMSKSFRVEECLPEIVKEGLAFIERSSKSEDKKPFFLYLPLTGPHTPWMPGEKFRGKSPIGLYGDFVMEIDDVVAQVTAKLMEEGVYKNTLLVFTSDNGAYCPEEEIQLNGHDSNQGRRGQKGDIWDGGHHVPLVLTWPAGIKPGSSDHLVSLTDLFATFSKLTGQQIAEGQAGDSFSFLHLLQGTTGEPVRPSMVHHSSRGTFGIRAGEWKFIDGLGSGGFTAPAIEKPVAGGPAGQLYRISSDPLESENLYLTHPDKVAEMKVLLQQNM
jgi:arylsulfatase A